MQSVGVWILKHDTTKSFGLKRRQYGEIIWHWKEELYHELMIKDKIFKGNTPQTVTFDVGEYVCSFVGGMVIILYKKGCNKKRPNLLVKMSQKSFFLTGTKCMG